ncbi:putative transmembrane protein 183BP isoform X2 [Physella acuta]|uniref:putative transmembrane protein 183BP isoform X2 n=1 Tax=Physella acuta TaxID=109671 RepID=UPI0027DAEB80|nr:putative transmembrane protein 183BP isoform X2 [Physella acuta]
MPKDGKKGKRRQNFCSSDITLHDFADAHLPQSCGRLKKSLATATGPGAIPKTVSAQKLVEREEAEALSWFEKDLEDFVIDDVTEEEHEEQNINGAAPLTSKDNRKKKKTTYTGGKVYPLDLWHLIGNFVHPDDVQRFAGICQGARSVTHTAAFWRKLYERYYSKGKEGLPDAVKPHSMEKLHGLRARVIRAMFYLYPPLISTVQIKGPMEDEPYSLKGHRCLLAWHQPAPKGWLFCFKFQKPSFQSLTSRPSSKIDLYHGFNDLFYNPEEGCSVLQVTCCHFASISTVMGLLLNQVYITLSTGFHHHRLRLHFDSRITTNNHAASEMVVVLDDVISIKLVQWWYPGYPFTN